MTSHKRTASGPLLDTRWLLLWMQLVEIAWSAPVVIGCRTAMMMAESGWPPSSRQRREYTRMVQEKAEAFGQAAAAAVATPPRNTAKAFGDVLAPVHRRVVANRRRLSGG